jgi:cytochrome b6
MINVIDEISQRIGLGSILSLARKKMVPVHRHSIWYYMGGMLLFLFMIQLITGPLLIFFYKPSADAA